MLRKFASLKEPAKYGYAFDTDCYDSTAFFSDKLRMFETYGDGLCQHSREWAVQVESLADYLASLATAMLAGDEELIKHARWEFREHTDVAAIEFAASVVFKPVKREDGQPLTYEKTRRYYSMEERKISAAPAKEYDKRYQRIESWCDGSVEAIYRMIIPQYAKGMEFYAYADAIRNWCLDCNHKDRPVWYGLTAQFLKWFGGDRQKAQDLRYAWNACRGIFQAYDARAEAECALGNLHWPPAPVEKPAESTEAA
jgi:hypothetical protein